MREIQVTFDCAAPGALSLFWAAVLGYQLDEPPPGFDSWPQALAAWGVPESEWDSRSAIHDPSGAGPRLFFQRVPEGKAVKNRLHLDVRAAPGLEGEARMAGLEAECERLVALGATRIERHEADASSGGFIVLADPEGNEFCLD
ncbi:MAG: VOC family protein [Actinobacteria bacterium]|nr:VOC family protein [Actinomycetota bacterium]